MNKFNRKNCFIPTYLTTTSKSFVLANYWIRQVTKHNQSVHFLICFRGLFYRVHLVPIDAHPPYIHLSYCKRNKLIANMSRCIRNLVMASDDRTDSGFNTDSEDEDGVGRRLVESVVEIQMEIEQFYKFRSNVHIEMFAAKCGEVDSVMILINNGEVQASLCKTAAAEMKKVFRTRRGIGIHTIPSMGLEVREDFSSIGINVNLEPFWYI